MLPCTWLCFSLVNLSFVRIMYPSQGTQGYRGREMFLLPCISCQDVERECSKSGTARRKPGGSSQACLAGGTGPPCGLPCCGRHQGPVYNSRASLANRNHTLFRCQAAKCFLERAGQGPSPAAGERLDWSEGVMMIPFHLSGIGLGMVMEHNSGQ